MVSVTSARPSGGRPAVPAKMTSSILPPRSALAPCSPSTHAIASTTLDLPEPLGPTTHVMPGSNRRLVAEAKDLKPFSVRDLRCTTLRRRTAVGPARGRALGAGLYPAREPPRASDLRDRRRSCRRALRARRGDWRRGLCQDRLGQLGEPSEPVLQVTGLSLGAQSIDLGFQVAYSGPEVRHLVQEATIRNSTDIAEKGLRHLVGLHTRRCGGSWEGHAERGSGSGACDSYRVAWTGTRVNVPGRGGCRQRVSAPRTR